MAYYGQWNMYAANFPVPIESTYYANITHFVYGFMGFNPTGGLGTWDAPADFSGGSPSAKYDSDFLDSLGKALGKPTDPMPVKGAQFQRMAFAKNKFNIKNIISLGGWQYDNANKSSNNPDLAWCEGQSPANAFYAVAKDTTLRVSFLTKLANFIKNTNYQMMCKGSGVICSSSSVPVLVTIPSGNDWSGKTEFQRMPPGYIIDPNYKTHFALFDGVDIDWEYPAGCNSCENCDYETTGCSGSWKPVDQNASASSYASLLVELKSLLGSEGIVTTTVGGDPAAIKKLFELSSKVNPTVKEAFNQIDRVSIMTYDYMNGNQYATHNAPLYKQVIQSESGSTRAWNADDAVVAMKAGGVPAANINIGAPFYGRFQFILKADFEDIFDGPPTVTNLKDSKLVNNLFSGTTPALYFACSQDTTDSEPCPWVSLDDEKYTIGMNTVGFDMNPPVTTGSCSSTTSTDCIFPSCGICGTKKEGSKPENCPQGDQSWVSRLCCCNNGANNNLCSFDTDLTNDFVTGWDDVKKENYYISAKTVKVKAKSTLNFNGGDCYILLSMPSVKSVKEKANYVNDQSLGGIITWMGATDVKDTLAAAIATVLPPGSGPTPKPKKDTIKNAVDALKTIADVQEALQHLNEIKCAIKYSNDIGKATVCKELVNIGGDFYNLYTDLSTPEQITFNSPTFTCIYGGSPLSFYGPDASPDTLYEAHLARLQARVTAITDAAGASPFTFDAGKFAGGSNGTWNFQALSIASIKDYIDTMK